MFEKSGETNFFTNSQMDEEKSTEVKLRQQLSRSLLGKRKLLLTLKLWLSPLV